MATPKLHKNVLYTQVRVKTGKAGGSGTVIYSEEGKKGFSTYVITCWHVIEDALKVKREYDPRIGRDRKYEYRQVVTVEFFDYEKVPHGRRPISNSVDGDVMAYDKSHDMALIKLRTKHKVSDVARFFPRGEVEKISIGDKNFAVGCALLHDPILTEGMITHLGDEIDYKDYWMSSAQIIFGNSGGAIFYPYKDNYYLIGIPSRIDIHGWGDPITHLGYFSPIHRIYAFLEEQKFRFVYDSAFTEEAEEREREKVKKEAERFLLFEPAELNKEEEPDE